MAIDEFDPKNNASRALNSILVLLLALTIPLMFTTELKVLQHRLIPFVWNIGHVALFFTLMWLVLNLYRPPRNIGFWPFIIGVNILVMLIGLGIEEFQLSQGRQSSFEDIYKNCLGASLAVAFHPNTLSLRRPVRLVLRIVLASLLLIALLPLMVNTLDWFYARASFPVLADFESPFEEHRWSGEDRAVVSSADGNHRMKKRFRKGRYSTLSFFYFSPDWSGFECIRIRVDNPGDERIRLHLRINDRLHNDNERRYVDRFNHKVMIDPGRNEIRIPLESIRTAPRQRDMDLRRMEEITFFSANLREEIVLYFDDLELLDTATNCPVEMPLPEADRLTSAFPEKDNLDGL